VRGVALCALGFAATLPLGAFVSWGFVTVSTPVFIWLATLSVCASLFPSPRPSRHDRCLAHIAEMERELGLGEAA
jgi:hypothetical protein